MSVTESQTSIRLALPSDDPFISALLPPAGQEAKTLASLQESGNLSLSLITAIDDPETTEPTTGQVIAVLAISPISLLPRSSPLPSTAPPHGGNSVLTPTPGWFALGPIYVSKFHRRKGVGTRLVLQGLDVLEKTLGASGVVVVGFPSFYRRLGFAHEERVTFDGAPEQYFMVKRFFAGREKETEEGGVVRDFGALSTG